MPRYRNVPPAHSSAGQEAIELIAAAGQPLDPWQCDVMTDGLGEQADGQWAATEVALIVPRQNGKGTCLEAKGLHALYLSGSRLILWSAHEFKTAREGFLRVRDLITNCDDLRKRVRAVRVSHGEEGIELLDGRRLNFVARSRGSGRGFTGDDIILDEAYALTDEGMSALMPTVSARPNPQIWYASSAPLAASTVLRRICKRGRAGAPGLVYLEWCAADGADSADRGAWADANPALGVPGHGIGHRSVERELAAMDENDFRRERLGIVSLEHADRVIPVDAWEKILDPRSRISGPRAFSVDIRPDRGATAIGVAGFRVDGRIHHELVDYRPGTGWAVARLLGLTQRWPTCAVALDATGPAAAMIPDLERAGVHVRPPDDRLTGEPLGVLLEAMSTSDMARACGIYYDAVTEQRARRLDQAPVNAAVAGAVRYLRGDAWTWSRRDSTVDICPLVAVTAAGYALAVHGGQAETEIVPMVAWR